MLFYQRMIINEILIPFVHRVVVLLAHEISGE